MNHPKPSYRGVPLLLFLLYLSSGSVTVPPIAFAVTLIVASRCPKCSSTHLESRLKPNSPIADLWLFSWQNSASRSKTGHLALCNADLPLPEPRVLSSIAPSHVPTFYKVLHLHIFLLQEASGYFFCLEDRALFCRSCDVAIHTNNPYVSAHRRFLISGVQVGLEHPGPVSSVAKEQSNSTGRIVEPLASGSSPLPLISGGSNNGGYSNQAIKNGYAGGSVGGDLPDWPLDDLFGFTDYNHNYGSPKADSGKLWSSEGSPPTNYFPADEGLDMDECFGQVPEMSYNAPQVPSPPTASGLHWQRNLHYHNNNADRAASVPDIYSSCQGRKR